MGVNSGYTLALLSKTDCPKTIKIVTDVLEFCKTFTSHNAIY